ncbi:MAG: four helix bundle protein [Clostridiales bacterium]|nr:four helix bundle protein [Clostridiales bacterium]
MKESIISAKSKAFALRIIRLHRYLTDTEKEYVLSKQLLRCGTSIGANTREAYCAQSRPDFYAKMYIAYKEANETAYWLELLHESEYIDDSAFDSIYTDCKEIIKILAAVTKNQKLAT